MKKIIALLSAMILFCFSACSQSGNQNTTDSATVSTAPKQEETKEMTAQDKLKGILDDANFSGIVTVTKDENQFFTYTKGTLRNGEAITIDTPMPIGSNSKHFCAAVIMLLQEEGKLSIDDTLSKYYPDYQYGATITLRNLLNMTAGIKEVSPDDMPYHPNGTKEQEQKDIDAQKAIIFSNEPVSAPGVSYNYSNINYFLLSDIAKIVTGKDITTLLREYIFEPLKMTHTGTVYELSDSPKWAEGYSYVFDDVSINYNMVGAGGIISSASDMQIWMNALPQGKVVSKESYKLMTTPAGESIPYGFGLSLREGEAGHGGFIGIYSATIDMAPERKLTVFMASDTIGTKTQQDIMFERLLPQIEQ